MIPSEFYYVREEITPKASYSALQIMSCFIYTLCFISFIVIFLNESKVSFTESKIVDKDISNNEWDCQMISKVTSEYAIDTDETFYLVNTMQSKGECSSTLNNLAPCLTGLTFINDSATKTILDGISIRDIVSTSKSVYLLNDNSLSIDEIDLSTGTVETILTSTYIYSLAVDGKDQLYYYSAPTNTYGYFYFYDPITKLSKLILTFPLETFYISNFDVDVSGTHLYFMALKGVSVAGSYSKVNNTAYRCTIQTAQCEVLFKYDAYSTTQYLKTFGSLVYSSSTNTLYFINGTNSIYSYKLDVPSTLGIKTHYTDPDSITFSDLDIDSDENIYTQSAKSSTSMEYLSRISVDGLKISLYDVKCSTLCLDGITRHPTKNYIYTQYLDPSTLKYSTLRGLSNQLNEPLNPLSLYSGSVGWFTCGNTLQAPIQDVTSNSCLLNGIMWKLYDDTITGYFFSKEDFGVYLIPIAQPSCTTADYSHICYDIVGNLPPYSCVREIKNSVLNSLSISFANTQVLFTVLIILAGLTLQQLSKYGFSTWKGQSQIKHDTLSIEIGASRPSTSTNNPISNPSPDSNISSGTGSVVTMKQYQDLLLRLEQAELRLKNLESKDNLVV